MNDQVLPPLLVASGNKKKLVELRRRLEHLGVQLVVPAEVGGIPDTVEDAPDFEGNARKKAREAAHARGMWALADDSGLEVDALGGAPGVLSARYAGRHGDDAANNAKLLADLSGVPDERRGARFVCVLALARPDGSIALLARGEAHGRILHAPRGERDFGYDPLFEFAEPGLPQSGRGFAELEPEEKDAVSHRGRALARLAELLSGVLREA